MLDNTDLLNLICVCHCNKAATHWWVLVLGSWHLVHPQQVELFNWWLVLLVQFGVLLLVHGSLTRVKLKLVNLQVLNVLNRAFQRRQVILFLPRNFHPKTPDVDQIRLQVLHVVCLQDGVDHRREK